MAAEELTAFEKFVLDEVGTISARYAQARDNPMWAADVDVDDREELLSYLDTALTKLLTLTGILRANPQNSGTRSDPVDVAEELKNSRDLPPELWKAASCWVLSEWFKVFDAGLSQQFMADYERESTDHRFSPGTKATARRQFRFV